MIYEKEIQTWEEITKDAKAQDEHAQKEIKANVAWIEVVEKQKGTILKMIEITKATLEEETKRKARAYM